MSNIEVSYTIMCAMNDLALCSVSLNDANQSLPNKNLKCSNGIGVDSVYFGVNETIDRVRASLEEVWSTF